MLRLSSSSRSPSLRRGKSKRATKQKRLSLRSWPVVTKSRVRKNKSNGRDRVGEHFRFVCTDKSGIYHLCFSLLLYSSSSLFLFFCLVSQVSSQSIPSIHIFPLSFLAVSKSRLVTRKSERHFIALSIRTFKLFWGERFCDVLYFPCCSVPGCPFLIIIH